MENPPPIHPIEAAAAIARNREYWETLWEDPSKFTPGEPIFITAQMAKDLMRYQGWKTIPTSYYVMRPMPIEPSKSTSGRQLNRSERRNIHFNRKK